MQFVLLLFIFPSFAFFGLESYTRFRDSGNSVAKVAGHSITQQEFDNAQREQMERFRQMFGQQFDPGMLDTPEARRNILDGLITERVLAKDVADKHLSVSDQALRQTILSMPGMLDSEGKFDGERYKSLLAMRGMTPQIFEARLRRDIALQQMDSAIQSSVFVPNTVASLVSDLYEQERTVQQLLFKPSDYVSQVKVTDEMVKEYYDKNGVQFEIPEQVKANYVVLDRNAVASQIQVSDADIKSYYDQNQKRYSVDEQRRASHILLTVQKGASAADKAAVKDKAEKLVAQLRKNPGDFAKLAKENSQDPGSAEQGGDLGFFGKGMMVKPFEDAVYKLKEGEISDPVESEFGYHIIKVTGIKPASVKSLAEVKNEVAGEIKKQLAAKKYSELAEVFSNTVYEQSDSLKPVADKLGLKIETLDNVTRTPNPKQPADAPYNQPKFLQALFSDEAIKNKRNTEAVEVAPSTLIAGHVLEYKPVTKRPLDEVRAMVRERLVQAEAAKLARKAGEEKLAQLKTKDDTAGFSEAKTVSRVNNQGLAPTAFAAVMKADTSKLPAYTGADMPGQGYAVFRIGKVSQPATVDKTQRQAQQAEIRNALGQQNTLAYINALKQSAKVEILKPELKPASERQKDGNNPDVK